MQQIKVRYGNRGLANFYGDYILINRGLKEDKILRDYIIKHEIGHSEEFDFEHDFSDGINLLFKPKILFKLLKFYLLNPSTWIDFLPIQYSENKIVYDLNLIILYGIISFLAFFGFALLF